MPPKGLWESAQYDWRGEMKRRAREAYESNRFITTGWLDVDDKHPALFGDAILLRDDDGMGFGLDLEQWRGQHVRVTIERAPTDQERIWPLERDR